MMNKKVTYSKEMRERAKQDGKCLVTVDVPGMCVQGPFTQEQAREALRMVTRWITKDRSKEPPQ